MYWVITVAPNGRFFLVDIPFKSLDKAEGYQEAKYPTNGKVMITNSSDRVEAAREIRDQLSSKSGNWGKNFGHVR